MNINNEMGIDSQYAEMSDRDKALERRVKDLFCAECGTHEFPFVVHDETEVCLSCHGWYYQQDAANTGGLNPTPLTYGEDGYPTARGSETDYDRLIQEEGR